MADSLLFVESRFAEIDGLNPMYTAPAQTDQLFMVSRRQLLDAQRIVIRECLHNLGHIKSVIGIYIDNAFDEKQLDTLGVFANQVRGGLVLLELARPAAIVGAATHFINKLSHEKVAAGDLPRMMEALADVLITIEHYLEEYEVSKKGDESLLLIAEKSLETLGYTGVSS
jgi:chemosensory pili system protein ChpA (sensor histidine kinase/response regulator)